MYFDFFENYEISHGPVQQYIHYAFEVPNENLNFIKSKFYSQQYLHQFF